MRTFVPSEGSSRKFVKVDVQGRRMIVVQGKADGTTARSEKELGSEAEAAKACALMVSGLIERGYVERMAQAAPKAAAARKPAAARAEADHPGSEGALSALAEELNGDAEAPVLLRSSRAPAANGKAAAAGAGTAEAPEKPEKKKKKKKKRREQGDKPDMVFIGGISVAGAALIGLVGYFVWASFLKPASIIGTWQGSKLDYEIGGPITYDHYHLILDNKNRAAITMQRDVTMIGTYKLEGKRLKLHVWSEKESMDLDFKYELGSVELNLFDPQTDKPVVRLIRLFKMEPVPPAPNPPPASPADDKDDEDDMDSGPAPGAPPGAPAGPGAGAHSGPPGGGPGPGPAPGPDSGDNDPDDNG